MSVQNHWPAKQDRRPARWARKAAARKRIVHNGVQVRREDVARHRYLAERGLPHSDAVASVYTGVGE